MNIAIITPQCEHRFAIYTILSFKIEGISDQEEKAIILCINCGQVKKVNVIDESH